MDLSQGEIEQTVLLWISNPYRKNLDIERRENARWLGSFTEEQIVAAIREIIDTSVTSYQKCGALIAAGMYDYRLGDSDIFSHLYTQEIKQELQQAKINVPGVIAACKRCEDILDNRMAGRSSRMKQLREQVWSACFGGNLLVGAIYPHLLRQQNILLLGESGTGKDVVAQAILQASYNAYDTEPRPFDSVNVSAMSESLIDSELFGHVKGAYTGADRERKGAIANADGGTFFIDEVGDIPLPTQTKFLRVMESGELRKVGSDKNLNIDVSYVSATHKPLEEMIESGGFRRDLFYRLGGIIIRLPALRELEPKDRWDIANSFLPQEEVLPLRLQREELERFTESYHWPGNNRELRNAVFEFFLQGHYIERKSSHNFFHAREEQMPQGIISGSWTLEHLTNWYITWVLNKQNNNKSQTAQALGISPSTIHRFCKEKN